MFKLARDVTKDHQQQAHNNNIEFINAFAGIALLAILDSTSRDLIRRHEWQIPLARTARATARATAAFASASKTV
jgi:hypothetical protein